MLNLQRLPPAQAAAELLRRRAARRSLLDFTTYTMPSYRIGAHHKVLAEALEGVARGEVKRLMVFMPPRHGKSELVSKRFPAWFLARHSERQFISASYGQELASDFGREVRNIIADQSFRVLFPTITIAADSAAKHRWHTNEGGSYVAAGVQTAVTGRGAHILNIDDPVKDRAEAESETVREAVWNWYTSTAYTRLMPEGAVILTMTRWNQDDLAGRLLDAQESGGDQWHVVSLPALATANDDPIGRAYGDALWPEAYSRDALNRIRAAVGERDWSALYQQNPRPAEGALFKTAQVATLDAAPQCAATVRAWDLAATAQTGTRDPDWTAGVLLGRTATGGCVVLDVVRLRGGPDEVEAAIVATASRDGRANRISLPQDPGQAGKQQVLYLTRKLAGYRVESSTETGDKATRAAPVASQCNVGNLSIVRAPWNAAFLDELSAFPNGAKDDQVDALSRAFGVLSAARGPMHITAETLAAFARR